MADLLPSTTTTTTPSLAADMDSDSSLTELSSDLSSIGSLSPMLGYPSPDSSQGLGLGDEAATEALSKKRKLTDGEGPEKKKRKRPEPKPRTTENLDLTHDSPISLSEQSSQLDTLMRVLRKRRKIVVVAGAGISVSAGIPDFRSSTGLFKSLKSEHKLKASGKQLFDASVYQTDKSTGAFHEMVRNLSGMVSTAKPTAFHHMLSTLGEEGRLLRLYTQNVDGIDVALPSLETSVPLPQKGPWPRSVQLHGGLEKMVCSKCHALSDFQPELFDGPVPPACEKCMEADRIRTDHAGKRSHGVGRLRPRMVLYNEHNPDEDAIGAVMSADLRARPDAIIVVGTSLKIPGVRRIVKEMCGVVRGRRDGVAIWINQDGPPTGIYFDDCWDLIVKGQCDEVANQWSRSESAHEECTASDVERIKEHTKVEVVVNTPQKQKLQGLMTPVASPMAKPIPTVKFHVKNPKDSTSSAKATKKTKTAPKIKKENGTTGTKVKRVRKKKITDGEAGDGAKKPLAKAHFKVSKPVTKPKRLPKGTSSGSSSPDIKPILPLSPTASRNNVLAQKLPSPAKAVLFPNLAPQPVQPRIISNPQADLSFGSSLSDTSILTDFDSSILEKAGTPTDLRVGIPRTPTENNLQSPSAEKLGTVSPPSVPRGMEGLLH